MPHLKPFTASQANKAISNSDSTVLGTLEKRFWRRLAMAPTVCTGAGLGGMG
ncbi:hypothetical protein D9M73_114300 [compost metagenome]